MWVGCYTIFWKPEEFSRKVAGLASGQCWYFYSPQEISRRSAILHWENSTSACKFRTQGILNSSKSFLRNEAADEVQRLRNCKQTILCLWEFGRFNKICSAIVDQHLWPCLENPIWKLSGDPLVFPKVQPTQDEVSIAVVGVWQAHNGC